MQSAPIASLVVTVTASDINPPLVFNLTLESGVATGMVRIPAGSARTLTVSAFDATGLETHRGSKTVDVVPGANPEVSLLLQPIAGQQPIQASLATLTVAITPVPAGIGQQESLQLTASVTGPTGPVATTPGDIHWATATPGILSVNPATGVATGRAPGSARIVATYAGTAGVATIAVNPVVLAAGDIAECEAAPDGRRIVPPFGDAEKETALILDTLQGTVLVLGDNAYEDGLFEEYMCSYEPTWGRHKQRTYAVPGNHEYNSGGVGYYEYFGTRAGEAGKGYYSFDLGAWHVIALNSELRDAAMTQQLNWLQNDLAQSAAKCVLALWHRPRFNSGERHGNDAKVAGFWDRLYAAKADVILNGHEHLYERFGPQTPAQVADPVNGLRQFTSGGGGASLYDFLPVVQPNSEARLRRHGVLRMVLGPDYYSWKFISRRTGLVEDSGTASCN